MRHPRALLLILAGSCYTQAQPAVYTLNPPEQCAQSAMVVESSSGSGLYGTSQTVAPGDNGGLYGASQRDAPGDNGGLYGASQRDAPSQNGGLYGATQRNTNGDLRCRRPGTPAEQCEIRSMQATAQLKHQSNAGEVAPVTTDQVESVRSSTYQSCMAGGPPGSTPPAPQ
ncbi:MAG TPA: hypothetical protein VGG74_35720 [Kofleriaceae bacterium]